MTMSRVIFQMSMNTVLQSVIKPDCAAAMMIHGQFSVWCGRQLMAIGVKFH